MILHCLGCGKTGFQGYSPFCDSCGEMVDVRYDLERVELRASGNPLVRFADLLPVSPAPGWPPVELSYTPCVHATRLGAELGAPRLYLKNETAQPTGTTKFRMALVALAFLREHGVRTFCTSSTGNSSTAFADAIRHFPDMSMLLFTAEAFRTRVNYQESKQITHHVLKDATFVDAFDCAGQFATDLGLTPERGFFNPGRREGLKIAFLEASEQVPAPIDWYVQAVSSAMGVYGCAKAARELHGIGAIARVPQLLCVQQESCAPMARAFGEGSDRILPHHIVKTPTGIAQAILRGNPTKAYPHVRRLVLEHGGDIVAVSEDQIRRARRMVEDLEGISPCFSASTAIAGLIQQLDLGAVPKNDVIMINLTGSDRPPDEEHPVVWLERRGDRWVPAETPGGKRG